MQNQSAGEKTIKPDLLDRKILFTLAKDARASHASIARSVRASRDTVNYRIRRLERDGVITGYRTIIDLQKFGFLSAHLFIQLKDPSEKIVQDIAKKMSQYRFVRAILCFNGAFDLEVALVARGIEELDSNINGALACCDGALLHCETAILSRTLVSRMLPRRFFDGKEDTKPMHFDKREADETDCKLLEILSEDALIPAYELGHKIGLSADAAVYRIRNLRAGGYILAYIPVIGMSRIDYHLSTALLRLEHMMDKEDIVLAEYLRTNKDVLWAARGIGAYNLIVYLATRRMSDANAAFSGIRSLLAGKVRDCHMLLNLNEYKFTYLPKGLLC